MTTDALAGLVNRWRADKTDCCSEFHCGRDECADELEAALATMQQPADHIADASKKIGVIRLGHPPNWVSDQLIEAVNKQLDDHAAQLAAKDESIRVWTAAHGNAHRRAEAALGLLRVLAGAESAYRANPNSVVAWDRMREAGDKSRALLDALTGETPGRAGGVEVGGG